MNLLLNLIRFLLSAVLSLYAFAKPFDHEIGVNEYSQEIPEWAQKILESIENNRLLQAIICFENTIPVTPKQETQIEVRTKGDLSKDYLA